MLLAFPTHEVVGELEWLGGTTAATGVVEIPDDATATLYISGDEPISLEFLRGLPSDKIVELHVQGPVIATSFPAVSNLAPGLRYLYLIATDLGDAARRTVADLQGLKALYCLGNGFTTHGLQQLTALDALEELCLEEEGLSASDLEFATRLPSLRALTCLEERGMDGRRYPGCAP